MNTFGNNDRKLIVPTHYQGGIMLYEGDYQGVLRVEALDESGKEIVIDLLIGGGRAIATAIADALDQCEAMDALRDEAAEL